MNEARTLIETAADGKGLTFELVVDPALPPTLIGDPLRLLQVLTHLLDNAVKFTEEGWVRASVAVAGVKPGSVDVRFMVEDSGIGIPAEHQGRLFESFSQADASITRKHGGAGLGLAICKKLVTLMGGSIEVRSTEGEGSAFSVALPLAVVPTQVRAEAPAGGTSMPGSTLEM
jgi:signal transduction histidine kinase